MTSRSDLSGEKHENLKLTGESKVNKFLSSLERSRPITPERDIHGKKTKPSIYHIVQELNSAKTDQSDVKIISGIADDLWKPKGVFTDTESTPCNKCRINESKQYLEGNVIAKHFKINLVNEARKTDDLVPCEATSNSKPPLCRKKPGIPGQKLQTSIEAFRMHLNQRKDEICVLQENMQDQDCEIETLKMQLCTYQQQIIEMKATLKSSEREMTLLKQTLSEEREISARLKTLKETELQIIQDLKEKNEELKSSNENLTKSLSLERDANRDLAKEIEIKQAKIQELAAKLQSSAGDQQAECVVADSRKQEQRRLSEELEKARQEILQQEDERKKIQGENEGLILRVKELEIELAKKAELADELQREFDKLKVENGNISDGVKVMLESQKQLLALNAQLTEVNGRLSKEKIHVQKTMHKLKATHRRVLMDLSKMLGTFKKQLLIKFKESEDLQQKLEKKEALLAKLAEEKITACCHCGRTTTGKELQTVQKPQDSLQHLNNCLKKKRNLISPLPTVCPENSKSGPSSFSFVNGCSDRGDISSLVGLAALRHSTIQQLPGRFCNTPSERRPYMHASLKQLGKRGYLLASANRNEMSKACNVHSPFLNISPALVNLGLSHLIGQVERLQKTSLNKPLCDKMNDQALDLRKRVKVDELIQTSAINLEPKISEISDDQPPEKSAKLLWMHSESDSTLFKLFSRFCSNIYDVIAKMVMDSTV